MNAAPEQEIQECLHKLNLINQHDRLSFEVLVGGVSSDIWKVRAGERVFCVKRALPKLKVADDWFAPIERNHYEILWYQIARDIAPNSAPQVLAQDPQAMLFAMEYLDPEIYKLWKTELRDGRVYPKEAAQVGTQLGKIHAGATNNAALEKHFPANNIFQMIRLEPYLAATATKHPDLKPQLLSLYHRTAATRLTMIHGDVSPKNILLGPNGPVFLDAECACIGDPAFDVAFCLNHFLLKCLWNRSAQNGFFECFHALTSSYLSEVSWEPQDQLEARAASLLPGLFLARIDGKSPVEYVTQERDKNKVRRSARALLLHPPSQLTAILNAWGNELSA